MMDDGMMERISWLSLCSYLPAWATSHEHNSRLQLALLASSNRAFRIRRPAGLIKLRCFSEV